MPNIEKLKAEITKALKPAQDLAKKVEDEGRDFTEDERATVKAAFDAATKAKATLEAAEGDNDMLKTMNALGLEYGAMAGSADAPTAKGRGLSVGQKFTESDKIKSWWSSISPSGGDYVHEKTAINSPAVHFGGVKDILSGSDVTDGPGLLVNRQELGLVDQGRFQRDLTLRNLVTNGQTTSDTIHFARELAYTNNAAPVAEAAGIEPYQAGAGQVQGLKPQSTFTFVEDQTSVKTIAHWIPITKRALSDAAQVRTLIDSFLRYGLEEELEDQMLNGSGTGQNFKGILNTSGIQAQAFDTDILVTTRRAKTKVRTVGKARASAYLLNPEDNETIDLATNGNGDYMFGGPAGLQAQTLWGIPRIESEAIPQGTGLVADFSKAILFDREQAGIQVSDSHADFFIRNLVAILAELRAAFVVIRPTAFVQMTLA